MKKPVRKAGDMGPNPYLRATRELAVESKNKREVSLYNVGSVTFRSPSSKAKMKDLSNRVSEMEAMRTAQKMESDRKAFERGDRSATNWYSRDTIEKAMKKKK